jgi:hypothetical protein
MFYANRLLAEYTTEAKHPQDIAQPLKWDAKNFQLIFS